MKNRVRTLTQRNLIFAGLILVLGLVLAFRGESVSSVDRESLPAVFPEFKTDEIRRVELSRNTADGVERVALQLVAGGNAWTVASHFDYPTQMGATPLLSAVADARDRGEVTRRKETFAKYAPATGWVEVRLTDVQGKDVAAFGIGRYVYPETFLRVGEGENQRVIKALNISPSDVRTDVRSWIDTRLWPELSANNAVRIDVEQREDKRTITLVKRGEPKALVGMDVPPAPAKDEGAGDAKKSDDPSGQWWMASPEKAEGDDLAVADLLRQFTGILVEDIVAADVLGAARGPYGLDTPEIVATLHHKENGKVGKHLLLVGARVEGKEAWYVQRMGARWVFTVGAQSLSRMRQMPATFRAPEPEPPADDGSADPAPEDPAPKAPAPKDADPKKAAAPKKDADAKNKDD